jgi:hypothetical protein
MHVTGWLVVEIKEQDLHTIDSLADSDYQSFIDFAMRSPMLQNYEPTHALGLLHEGLLICGFKEELSIEINGVKRFIYYGDEDQMEIKLAYSVIDGVSKLPIKISALGVYYNNFDKMDSLIYGSLNKGKQTSGMIFASDSMQGLSQNMHNLLKRLNSTLLDKERAMPILGNRNAGKMLNDINRIILNENSNKEKE